VRTSLQPRQLDGQGYALAAENRHSVLRPDSTGRGECQAQMAQTAGDQPRDQTELKDRMGVVGALAALYRGEPRLQKEALPMSAN